MKGFGFSCLLLVLAATARADTAPPALAADSREPLPCTAAQPLSKVCSCLIAKDDVGNECKLVGPQVVRGARLVRVGGGQQTVVYLATEGIGGWRIIHQIAWEQHHGKRESSMHPLAQTELTLGSVRVYRLDYAYSEETGLGLDDSETRTQVYAVLCPLAGMPGAPRCTVEVLLRCDETEESGQKSVHKRGTAQLTIAPDGIATLTRKEPRTGPTCLTRLGPHRIW